ncbi:MAG TPA: hypothetical protein VJ484_12720 [Lysobacter sp.]|nr:hypothetical protein [Lysobacter sp.]
MRRIVVCLLIAFASASVVARESKLSDADGGSCPSHSPRAAAARPARDAVVAPAPVNKTKASSVRGVGGDDVGNRMQSPRWHRFLPGMFR